MAQMLGKSAALPGPCTLAGGAVEHTVIKATYACPGGEVIFDLRHPSGASASATQTARFAVSVSSGSPPPGLAEALVASIRAHESSFQWRSPHPFAFPVKTALLAAAGILGIGALAWSTWYDRSARPKA